MDQDAQNASVKVLVSGRVQGVGFRLYCHQQAHQLGLTGYAKNLPDGNVEVLVCGAKPSIEQMLSVLHQGPPFAKVEHVRVAPCEPYPLPSFKRL